MQTVSQGPSGTLSVMLPVMCGCGHFYGKIKWANTAVLYNIQWLLASCHNNIIIYRHLDIHDLIPYNIGNTSFYVIIIL